MKNFLILFTFLFLILKVQAYKKQDSKTKDNYLLPYNSYNSDKYLYLDAKLIRAVVGVSFNNLSIAPESGTGYKVPNRRSTMVYLRNDFRVVSKFMDGDRKWVFRDALYLDLALGKLTVDPIKGNKDYEDKTCIDFDFGYQLLYGYRNKKWAALAGFDIIAVYNKMGSAYNSDALLDLYTPLSGRLEYHAWGGNECRMVLGGFTNFSSENAYRTVFFDFPIAFGKRFFLTCQYTTRKTKMETFVTNIAPASFSSLMFGFKVGSIY